MSDAPEQATKNTPSTVLKDTRDAYAIEAERLRKKAQAVGLDADDRAWLRQIHKDQVEHETARSEALLLLLGAKVNVKDMTPEQLAVLAAAITGGE